MAGKSSKTEVITLRVALAVATEWRALAEADGALLGSFIVGRAQAVPALHQQIEQLIEVGDTLRKAITTAEAEIAALKARPDPKPIDLDALEKEWRRKWEAKQSKAVAPTFSHGRGKSAADEPPTDFPKVDGSFFKPKQKVALEKIGKGKP